MAKKETKAVPKKDEEVTRTRTPLRQRFRIGAIMHWVVNALLPPVVFLLVQQDLTEVALAIIVVSKWRAIAVTPRYWFANLRANAVDFIVGLSVVVFIHDAGLAREVDDSYLIVQMLWTAFYGFWLLYLKPKSGELWVGMQAFLGLVIGLASLFLIFDNINEVILVALAWLIGASSARHFLSSYEEPYIRVVSVAWGIFIAQLAWLLGRWLIVYELIDIVRIPQISVIVGLIAYSIGELYHRYKQGTLTRRRLHQILTFGGLILAVVSIFSDWSGEV